MLQQQSAKVGGSAFGSYHTYVIPTPGAGGGARGGGGGGGALRLFKYQSQKHQK